MVRGWNLFKTVRKLTHVTTFTFSSSGSCLYPVGLRRSRNSLFRWFKLLRTARFPELLDIRTDGSWIRVTGRPEFWRASMNGVNTSVVNRDGHAASRLPYL